MAALNWFASAPIPIRASVQPIEQVIGDPSPWTGAKEVMHQFYQWHATFEWNAMPIASYLALKSHVVRGRGGAVIFKVPFPEARARRGDKAGDPTISGTAAAGSTSITITGGSGTFLSGDWIWISETTDVPRAYLVTSSETGGVIEIWPGLRVSHTNSLIHHIGRSSDPEIYDTMELATPTPSFGMVEVSPKANPPRFAYPMSLEFVSALRQNP